MLVLVADQRAIRRDHLVQVAEGEAAANVVKTALLGEEADRSIQSAQARLAVAVWAHCLIEAWILLYPVCCFRGNIALGYPVRAACSGFPLTVLTVEWLADVC